VKYRRLVVISRVHIYLVLQTPLHHLRLITFIIRHLFTNTSLIALNSFPFRKSFPFELVRFINAKFHYAI